METLSKALPLLDRQPRPLSVILFYSRDCVVGDANTSSLFDLWNGDPMHQARREMDMGEFKRARGLRDLYDQWLKREARCSILTLL